MDGHRNGSAAFGEDVVATVDAVQLPPVCLEFCDDVFAGHGNNYRSKLIYLLSTNNACIVSAVRDETSVGTQSDSDERGRLVRRC